MVLGSGLTPLDTALRVHAVQVPYCVCLSTQVLSQQNASLRWHGARCPRAGRSTRPLHRDPTPAASAGAAAVAALGMNHTPISLSHYGVYIQLLI